MNNARLIHHDLAQKNAMPMMTIMQVVLNAEKITGQRRLNNAIHGWQMPYIK